MELRLTRHARLRMVERGITAAEVRECILKGTKRSQADRIVAAYAYFEVVYRRVGSITIVITVQPRW